MRLIITFNNKNWPLPTPTPPVVDDRFRLEAIEASEITFVQRGSAMSTLQYSLDNGTTWTNANADMDLLLNAGEKAHFRGKITSSGQGEGATLFGVTGKVALKGNIMYLYDYEHPETTIITQRYCFSVLFSSASGIYSIEELEMPATTMATRCYSNMFASLTNITKPPKVFAATTLAQECMASMFYNCTSLTTTPTLLAKKVTASNAFYNMFSGCSSLNKVISYANSVSTGATRLWMRNVPATGDFYKLGSASWVTGENGIPTGWTEHTSL